MGEIKSTLDLVMEKTRHLSLSKAERADQRKAELKKIMLGIVQKYQDQSLSLEALKKELDLLKEKYADLSITDYLKSIVGEKLELDRDNARLFALLNSVAETDVSRLESIFDEFQKRIKRVSEKRIQAKKKVLADKFLISGSAVVPNLESDGLFNSELENIRLEYGQRLERAKAKLGL